MIKLIHTADLHLGAALPRLSGPGIDETRRRDFHQNFSIIVSKALEFNVDFLLISGDIFHSSDPSPRDFVDFCTQLGRLIDNGITTIAIAGNHDKPRVAGSKNPLQGLQESRTPKFYYFQSLTDEPLLVKGRDGTVLGIAPVPYVNYKLVELTGYDYRQLLTEKACELLEKMGDADVRVLMSHTIVEGAQFKPILPWFSEEPRINLRAVRGYDYIALGHVHTPQNVLENAYYAGSTEKISFLEKDENKRFLYVELEDGEVEVKEVKLPCRPMENLHITLGPSDDPTQTILDLIKKSRQDKEEAIIRLFIEADQATFNRLRIGDLENELLKAYRAYRLDRELLSLKGVEKRAQIPLSIRHYVDSYIESLDIGSDIKKRAKQFANMLLDEAGIQ